MRQPYAPPRYDDDEMLRRAVAVHERLDGRRTVRHFAPDPVPRAVLEEVIRAASTAPSGAHRQPWRWVMVGSPELKSRIRHAAEAEERRNYGGRMPPEWLQALQPFDTDHHKPYLEVAPWLVALFAQDRGDEGRNYYVSESCGIALGMFLAALHEVGLVAVTHTPSPMKFLKDILARPAGERAYMLLAVGHPAQGCTVPSLARRPLDEVLTVLT